MSRSAARLAIPFLLALAALSGCASLSGGRTAQVLDPEFDPPVKEPLHLEGSGPVLAIDEAHHNFHTADGRYGAFATLARKDGYRVEKNDQPFSRAALEGVDILVIANALSEDDVGEWVLPNPSAFTREEIDELVAWVEAGGSLFLIADHMPFPGAAEALWKAFGVFIVNGYAARRDGEPIIFRPGAGLQDHPVTRGIDTVHTFTGQGFRAVEPLTPILVLPADTVIRMTMVAGEFEDVPEVPGDFLLQGALAERGRGRIAFFGEAAMFSAQKIRLAETEITFGMNAPDAEQNVLFLRRILAWLAGAEKLPET